MKPDLTDNQFRAICDLARALDRVQVDDVCATDPDNAVSLFRRLLMAAVVKPGEHESDVDMLDELFTGQPATAGGATTPPVTLAGIPLSPCVCGGSPVLEDHRIVCAHRWAGGALLCSRSVTWSEAGSERTAAEAWNGREEAAP